MTAHQISLDENTVRVHLAGELTVEQAGAFHDELAAVLQPGRPLVLDATSLTRLDAAFLQVLVAAIGMAPQASLSAPAPALDAAFTRYGLPCPFTASTPAAA